MENDMMLKAYQDYMLLTESLLDQECRPLQLAPIMVKLGLEIYKTVLTEEEYQHMVECIYDNRDEIQDLKKFNPGVH